MSQRLLRTLKRCDTLVPNIEILYRSVDCIVLNDIGPWDSYKTITNDAERVVGLVYTYAQDYVGSSLSAQDSAKSSLPKAHLPLIYLPLVGPRIFYIDSEGELGELIHKEGIFVGFGIFPLVEELLTDSLEGVRQLGEIFAKVVRK